MFTAFVFIIEKHLFGFARLGYVYTNVMPGFTQIGKLCNLFRKKCVRAKILTTKPIAKIIVILFINILKYF